MSLLLSHSVPALAEAVRAKEISAVELATDALARIDAHDAQVNAVVHLDAERALAVAAQVDQQRIDAPDTLPRYAGVPTLVKDLNNVKGMPTTFGSAAMKDFVPPFDDETVRRMQAAGFIILGKSNTPEIGSLPTTEPALHGATTNPWSSGHSAGGSSGGAAAAVAAGYVPVAHGSDGGGSLRIPASCCGVVGLKPSRGRVSHAPLFGDQVMGYSTQGPIGRRVVDAAALLDVLQGYAAGDPYHLPPPITPYADEAGRDPGTLRIGLVDTTPWASPDDDVQAALALTTVELERLGHRVERLAVRFAPGVLDQFLTVWSATMAATPLPTDQLEIQNRAFAARGHSLSAAALLQAFTSLQVVSRAVVHAMSQVDVVLAPVLMSPPAPLGHFSDRVGEDLVLDDLEDVMSRYLGLTPVINVTGQPAIALPVHRSDAGLPVGVQLIANPGDEALLIRAGAQLESVVGWDTALPPMLGG